MGIMSSNTSGDPVSSTTSLVAVVTHFVRSYWHLLLFGGFFLRAFYRRYASPLRKYPGPVTASVTRLWKAISIATGNTHLHHIDLHRKYGPIVRIAPNEVSLASPQAARTLLSAGKRFFKTEFYTVFPPPENPDIFTEIREDVHAQKKRVANVPYGMGAMQQLSPFIDDTIELLARKLDAFIASQAGQSKQEFDLGAYLHYFAFDVLGEVAFSRPFGFLAEGRDVENAIKTIDNSQCYNGIVGQIPELDFLLRRNPLWQYIPWLASKNALITKMARESMDQRRPFREDTAGMLKSGDGRQDLLASLIQGHLKDPEKFGEGDVFAVAHGAIFAGSDSTASTMQSFFYQVLSSPKTYANILAELDKAITAGEIPATGNISFAQAQNLHYFQAALKEAMRVRPAVGLNISRYVPPEGAELEGHFFPGGTRVSVNGWVLHRNKQIFGRDADDFRAERWLADEQQARVMERYMFQFGGGSHLCIGRNLALLEINKVIPRILRDYHFELAHPDRPLTAHASFFVVQEGLTVYISKRK